MTLTQANLEKVLLEFQQALTSMASFKSATDHAREQLAATNGSITTVPSGTLTNEGAAWDAAQPWYGRELTDYSVRQSLWSKSIVVRFLWTDRAGLAHARFVLHLKGPLQPEEIALAADTYLMLLNMARRDA